MRPGKYWSSSFFASLWTEPQVYGSISNSLTGIAHFIGVKARATIRRENLYLLHHFRRISAKIFGQTTKKGFHLNVKMFSFECLFKNTNR